MIAVIAMFGILLLIGTIADSILNIMHLDIVPDLLLKVCTEQYWVIIIAKYQILEF